MSLLSEALRPARAGADVAGRLALAGLDALLAWRYTDEAIRRVLASPVVDRAVGHALSVRSLTRWRATLRATRCSNAPSMSSGVATRVIDSRLLDTIVERLLESEELWRLVDEIARSPAVMDAIGQQGAGFADQVAGQVRAQSQRADARVEQVARRLLRRKPPPSGAGHGDSP